MTYYSMHTPPSSFIALAWRGHEPSNTPLPPPQLPLPHHLTLSATPIPLLKPLLIPSITPNSPVFSFILKLGVAFGKEGKGGGIMDGRMANEKKREMEEGEEYLEGR